MSRLNVPQTQRTQNNPLMLGSFDSTAVKYLRGSLGPKNQVVGSADTWDQSRGGYGGGTYNHWFRIDLKIPGWILLANASPKPRYIQISAYDLNRNPIESRSLFQKDSIKNPDGRAPYNDHIMGAQSDLYNTFSSVKFDRGNEIYEPLETGSYLICISAVRNEPIDYAIAFVVEFPTEEGYLQLEDFGNSVFLTEDSSFILLDEDVVASAVSHEHSLSAWQNAWNATHSQDDRFPAILVPLATRA